MLSSEVHVEDDQTSPSRIDSELSCQRTQLLKGLNGNFSGSDLATLASIIISDKPYRMKMVEKDSMMKFSISSVIFNACQIVMLTHQCLEEGCGVREMMELSLL